MLILHSFKRSRLINDIPCASWQEDIWRELFSESSYWYKSTFFFYRRMRKSDLIGLSTFAICSRQHKRWEQNCLMHVAGGEYTLQPVTACILTSVIHGTDCLGNTGVWNEHLPNNRSSFWRGKIFIPNASRCVRACKNSMCKRHTSAVPRKQPAWNPDSISVFGIILEKGDNNLSRLFPKYYSTTYGPVEPNKCMMIVSEELASS